MSIKLFYYTHHEINGNNEKNKSIEPFWNNENNVAKLFIKLPLKWYNETCHNQKVKTNNSDIYMIFMKST